MDHLLLRYLKDKNAIQNFSPEIPKSFYYLGYFQQRRWEQGLLDSNSSKVVIYIRIHTCILGSPTFLDKKSSLSSNNFFSTGKGMWERKNIKQHTNVDKKIKYGIYT